MTTPAQRGAPEPSRFWETAIFAPPGPPDAQSDGPADLLIELPHGATEATHFQHARQQLAGSLPPDLEAFFWVNTDIGSPEVAARLATLLSRPRSGERPLRVQILRCLLPRTFVDANRRLEETTAAGMTAGLPSYVTHLADQQLLARLHGEYTAVAEAAYAHVCGAGGLALALHTYAPKTVEIAVDHDIVAALRAAYVPRIYRRWKRRPAIDLITRDGQGRDLSPPGLGAAVCEQYGRLGILVESNATYHLHEATMGYLHAERHPGRVLCLELDRGRLAAPFTPFLPSPISPRKVDRMTRPLAAAIATWLAARAPR